jgi:hypothetical protein
LHTIEAWSHSNIMILAQATAHMVENAQRKSFTIRVANTEWADAKIMLRLPALMDLVYID